MGARLLFRPTMLPYILSVALLVGAASERAPAAHGERHIEPGHTAYWYSSERSGEGLALEILSPELALVFWFTYDEDGEQRWLHAVGEIVEARIEIPELLVTSGGRFGPDFDPDEVVREAVGSASLEFSDCENGLFEFDAFGQTGVIPVRRLTVTGGLACGGQPAPPSASPGELTGTWYDPTHSGEGFVVQWMARGEAIVTWFSYDTDGNQFWMQGVGGHDGERFVFTDMYSTRGPRFGSDFDTADLEHIDWGALTLEIDCEEGGQADYTSIDPGFPAGTQELVALTRPEGVSCGLSLPPDLGQSEWTVVPGTGPLLSELPTAAIGGDIYVAGGLRSLTSHTPELWRFRPATGQWTRLRDMPGSRDHAMMVAYDGRLYYFGGYSQPIFNAARTAWRYDPATDQWRSLGEMPAAMAAGGAAVLDDHIYVMGRSSSQFYRYDPAAGTWEELTLNDTVARDHSAMVAYEGEIWVMGGRPFTHGETTIYNPSTGESRPGPAMNSPRSGFAATVVAGQILVAGGERISPLSMVPTVEVYHPALGQWQTIDSLSVAVHGAGAAVVDDAVYVMLGSTLASDIFNPGLVQRLAIP